MKFWLIVAGVLALAACKTKQTAGALPAGPAVEMTTAALYKEYAVNHAGAFNKHKGHALVVSGTTWGTAPEPFRVGLEVPDEPFGSILAQVDEKSARAAGLDQEGANAKLKCRWLEQDTEAVDISLSNCAIVE